MKTGEHPTVEFDISDLPDIEISKNLLWHEAVDHIIRFIQSYPAAAQEFLQIYLKYSILGHPRFGRLFIRIARRIGRIGSTNLVEAVETMRRSGYIYDGKSSIQSSSGTVGPEGSTAASNRSIAGGEGSTGEETETGNSKARGDSSSSL